MPIKIALAGNPNSGKTTLFNALTGSNQYVGNWPGVTVEKKEGKLKGNKDVTITDLPGIYSLSPYTQEEVVSRNYLIDERPDAILNIVDGTNLERNLFLTTQLTELGIPVVVVVNMMDVVSKKGDKINKENLARALGCKVVEISALKGTGITEVAEAAVKAADESKTIPQHSFSGGVEHTLAHIEEAVLHDLAEERQRFFAIKLFERDAKIIEKLALTSEQVAHIDGDIKRREEELDDDSESIITTERYNYIDSIIKDCCKIKNRSGLSTSDKIDKIVTNRWLALPIFAIIMVVVYAVSVTGVGGWATMWAEEGLFGNGYHLLGIGSSAYAEAMEAFEEGLIIAEPHPADYGVWVRGVPVAAEDFLESINCAKLLQGLIVDGIIAGVGSVLAFVPQIFVLFIFLAFLESCGYMARIAFILDRIFRKFGLSGKSFIPILIGTGCGVPGVMACRTIESDRDRRMTIMTTTFIPCAAKLPIIALISGALFGGVWWMAPSAYFVGIAAIICSSVILKKTKMFAGDVAPFVMELPAYHMPTAAAIMRSTWERGWSFIKKAGTIILLAVIFVWFAANFGIKEGSFGMVDMEASFLAALGGAIAWLFSPLGWGNWQSAVAAVTGLIAKENVVGTFGVIFGFAGAVEDGVEIWDRLSASFTGLSAYSFMIFNLLCAPCFAAIGAIRREMNSAKWFWFAIGYQTVFAYIVSLCVYQLGMLFSVGSFGIGTVVAFALLAGFIYMLIHNVSMVNNKSK